jgi:photosystem II stability/assembly factor-like uncharacterized protein
MNVDLFYLRKQKSIKWRKKSPKFRSVILFILSLFILTETFGDYYFQSCLASEDKSYKITRRDKAYSVFFLDEKTGWIVGDNGLSLTTTDSGASWQRLAISAEDTFNDVFFIEERGWIVGGGGLIMHTTDGGKTWKCQRGDAQQTFTETKMAVDGTCADVVESGRSLMKTFFLDKKKGFAVGADATILRTEDGGSSWEDVSLDCMEILPEDLMMNGIVSVNLYDVFFMNENSGWVVGDSGAVFHSEDGGKEWSLVNIGLLPSLFSIAFKNENEGWAVGQNGFSIKTNDGGKSWEKIIIDKESSLYSIRIQGNYGVIVGDQATIIGTTDGGNTWARVKADLKQPYPWFIDTWLFSSNSSKILSVGKGIIITTSMDAK